MPESDIRVKIYDHLNFSRAFVIQFRPSRYIICPNRTFESKVMAVWICIVLSCLISSIPIYYAPKSDIRVKSYDHMSLSRASDLQFRASQYIISLNQTSESKVKAVWICRVLPFLISSILIYNAPESNIWVKSYDHLNFSIDSFVPFRVTEYIIGLNRTSESKVMVVLNWHVLPCLISSISLYYSPESHIWVKSYEHMSLPRASVVQFLATRYVTGINRTSESKVMAV